jgi:trehalose synthase
VGRLREVEIAALRIDRFVPLIGSERGTLIQDVAAEARVRLAGRTVWNVNSTGAGGGVAEMLQVLLAYARGSGVDARWLVVQGGPEFFAVTKRLHNRLHGYPGDGGPLAEREREVYEATLRENGLELAAMVRPGDFVLLHDPQTAGLVETALAAGARVIWRCHIGADGVNDHIDAGQAFLRPYLERADAFVFSRRSHVHPWMGDEMVAIIPPSIDPFSPKNQELDPVTVRAILGRVGFMSEFDVVPPVFRRRDGSPYAVTRPAVFPRRGETPDGDTSLVIQVSRWDRLKDMTGVLAAFAEHVPGPAHLALVGPSVEDVSDDPEGAQVLEECVALFDTLPAEVQARTHLVCLPMDDVEENAAMVNALQRHATVVVQKSLQEGFGLTVSEAMIKSRAVAASRVGGIGDQIRHEQEGLLIDRPTDPAEFGSAVNRLLHDRSFATVLGAAARQRVLDAFVGDRHLMQYALLLDSLS